MVGLTERRSEVHQPGWTGRMRQALVFGLVDREAPLVALAGFLVRGGIVLLLLPAVVLPSIIEIANIILMRFVGIDGQPMALVFEAGAAAVVASLCWLVLASVVGAVVDIWLVQMALDGRRGSRRGRLVLPDRGRLARIVAIRMGCLVPVAIALAWAAARIVTATYDELIAPTNPATPLPLRVFFACTGPAIVIVAVWLASESFAAIAVRHHILTGTLVWRSFLGAAKQIVRRPVSTVLTVIVSYGASAVAVGLAMLATWTAFDWCRIAARNAQPVAVTLGIGTFSTTRDFRPVVFTLAAISLALAWMLALALSGVSSAWRSAAFTREVADATHGCTEREPANVGLSGQEGERSGD